MKLILTGCTGFIGGEVLTQCLRNPEITSVVVLTRRKLTIDITKTTKLSVIVMEDFNAYSDTVLKELSGADACIWCMGTTAGDKVLEIDYPLAFAAAISKTFSEREKKFCYIHLSGAATERDQGKLLWFKGGMRKTKGQAEQNMLEVAKREESKGLWQTLIVKAGFVVSKEGRSPRDLMGWVMGTTKSIQVDYLAAAMIEAALTGNEDGTLQGNEAMVKRGRQALIRMKE